jgi:hypothetical protein
LDLNQFTRKFGNKANGSGSGPFVMYTSVDLASTFEGVYDILTVPRYAFLDQHMAHQTCGFSYLFDLQRKFAQQPQNYAKIRLYKPQNSQKCSQVEPGT